VAGGRRRRKRIAATLEPNASRCQREQPGDDAQQCRLSGTVGACDHKGLAAAQREADILENGLAAARSRNPLSDQTHSIPIAESLIATALQCSKFAR
jgi:hypothetical protein